MMNNEPPQTAPSLLRHRPIKPLVRSSSAAINHLHGFVGVRETGHRRPVRGRQVPVRLEAVTPSDLSLER